jgi:lipid-A-disaccharide synthase
MISAGEASGDRLGAGLARSLRRLHPGVELLGMGGDEMASAGVRLVQHAQEVAVVGFVEVVRHLPTIRRAMVRVENAVRDERPASCRWTSPTQPPAARVKAPAS